MIKSPCNKLHSSLFFFPLLFRLTFPFFFLYGCSNLLAYKTKHFAPANTKTLSRAQRIQLVKGLVTRLFKTKQKKNIDVYILFSSSTTNFSPRHVRSVGFFSFQSGSLKSRQEATMKVTERCAWWRACKVLVGQRVL